MNEKVKDELDKIVYALANTGIVSRILLFGSYAKGKETPKSDIDLCVLSPITDKTTIDLIADFRLKTWDVRKTPMDLLAYNHDAFYRYAANPTSFEHEIAESGVLIYEHG